VELDDLADEIADQSGFDRGYARCWLELNPGDTVIMRNGSSRTAEDY